MANNRNREQVRMSQTPLGASIAPTVMIQPFFLSWLASSLSMPRNLSLIHI